MHLHFHYIHQWLQDYPAHRLKSLLTVVIIPRALIVLLREGQRLAWLFLTAQTRGYVNCMP